MEELMMRTRQFTIEDLFQERVETKEEFEDQVFDIIDKNLTYEIENGDWENPHLLHVYISDQLKNGPECITWEEYNQWKINEDEADQSDYAMDYEMYN